VILIQFEYPLPLSSIRLVFPIKTVSPKILASDSDDSYNWIVSNVGEATTMDA
jgi:hypothetical protein